MIKQGVFTVSDSYRTDITANAKMTNDTVIL